MPWIADRKQLRTLKPEAGLELYVEGSGTEGDTTFRIEGTGVLIRFTASVLEAPLSNQEESELGITDAIVWFIWGGDRLPEAEKVIIASAMKAFKLSHGFQLSDAPILLRFGRGAIFRG
ncbi:hypothetical protein LCM18_05805 [Qipengyuania flava]|nr:hypothetical protein LCM18_05805 [Qipengyuania flava]